MSEELKAALTDAIYILEHPELLVSSQAYRKLLEVFVREMRREG